MKAKDLHHTPKPKLEVEDEEPKTTEEETPADEPKSFEDQDQTEDGTSSSVKNVVEQSEEVDKDEDQTETDTRKPEHQVEELPNEKLDDDDFDDQNLDQLSQRPTSGMNPSRPKSFSLDDDSGETRKFSGVSQRLNSQMPSGGLYSKNRPRKSGALKFLLLLIVALLVIGGSIYVLKGQASVKRLLSKISPSETSAPTPMEETSNEPTPSPTPAFDRSLFTIKVLNGTSKTGLAASISAKLVSLGYQDGKTGNATNSAFPRTVVLVKDDNASLSAQLIQDLSPDYDATTSGSLKSSDKVDGEVILGAK